MLRSVFNFLHDKVEKTSRRRVQTLAADICESKTGQGFYAWTLNHINSIAFVSSLPRHVAGTYQSASNRVLLNPKMRQSRLICTVSHEARHAWQSKTGVMDFKHLSARENIFLRRVIEADAFSYSFCFGLMHERQTGGIALLTALKRDTFFSHLLKVYRQLPDTHRQDIAKVRRAMFDAFFAPENPNLALYDAKLNKNKGWRDRMVKAEDDPKCRKIDFSVLTKIGQMGDMGLPQGNFLTDVPGRDLRDPYYWQGIDNALLPQPRLKSKSKTRSIF